MAVVEFQSSPKFDFGLIPESETAVTLGHDHVTVRIARMVSQSLLTHIDGFVHLVSLQVGVSQPRKKQ